MFNDHKPGLPVLLILLGMAALCTCRREEPETAPQKPDRAQEALTQEPEPLTPAATADAGDDSPARPPATRAAGVPAPVDTAVLAAQRELAARWDKHNSISAKVETDFIREEAEPTHQTGTGERDCMKKNGKMLLRSRLFNSITFQDKDGKWLMTGKRMNLVFDGEFVYRLEETHDKKVFTKSLPTGWDSQPIGGEGLFVRMRQLETLELLPDQIIDGKSVYVFAGSADQGRMTSHHFIDKETGILLKLVIKRKDPESTYTLSLSDIELDVEFPEDHFTLVPPEGAEIKDLTKEPPGAGPTSPMP